MIHGIKAVAHTLGAIATSSLKKSVVFSIASYQRYLSPLKGFACAHRVHHQGESCSAYIKKAFIENDLQTAIVLSKRRFRDCAHAAHALEQMALEQTAQPESGQLGLQSAMGRRGALRFFSLFTFGMFAPRVQSGCPGIQVCCSGFFFEEEDDEDDDDDDDDD